MKYKTLSVAYNHFVVALLLFVLQVIAGLWIGIQYVFPDFFYQNPVMETGIFGQIIRGVKFPIALVGAG